MVAGVEMVDGGVDAVVAVVDRIVLDRAMAV